MQAAGYDTETLTTASIQILERIDVQYALAIQAAIDLTPLFDYLRGDTVIYTDNNNSQLLVQIDKISADGTKKLIGLYYVGGVLYVDASNFGIDRIAIELDLFELIVKLILKDKYIELKGDELKTVAEGGYAGPRYVANKDAEGNVTYERDDVNGTYKYLFDVIKINPVDEATSAADDQTTLTDEEKAKLAIVIKGEISKQGVMISVVKGIVEMLNDLVGLDLDGISLWLNLGRMI